MDMMQAKDSTGQRKKVSIINKNVIMLIISVALGVGGVYLTKEFYRKKGQLLQKPAGKDRGDGRSCSAEQKYPKRNDRYIA
ncbi:MAG: hypothetical protein AB2595_02985 [Candidatus Thiodiazotropha endolucinida]